MALQRVVSVSLSARWRCWPAAVFSATLRAAVSAENAGGLLGTTTAAVQPEVPLGETSIL